MSVPKNIFTEDGDLSADFWKAVLTLAERAVEALESLAEARDEGV